MNISKFHLITSLSFILFFYLLWASAFHWNLLLRLHLCKLIKRFCTGEFYCPIGPSSFSEVFSSFSFFLLSCFLLSLLYPIKNNLSSVFSIYFYIFYVLSEYIVYIVCFLFTIQSFTAQRNCSPLPEEFPRYPSSRW